MFQVRLIHKETGKYVGPKGLVADQKTAVVFQTEERKAGTRQVVYDYNLNVKKSKWLESYNVEEFKTEIVNTDSVSKRVKAQATDHPAAHGKAHGEEVGKTAKETAEKAVEKVAETKTEKVEVSAERVAELEAALSKVLTGKTIVKAVASMTPEEVRELVEELSPAFKEIAMKLGGELFKNLGQFAEVFKEVVPKIDIAVRIEANIPPQVPQLLETGVRESKYDITKSIFWPFNPDGIYGMKYQQEHKVVPEGVIETTKVETEGGKVEVHTRELH